MSSTKPLVLPLASPLASLEQVGGKALSLGKLAALGLPVPDGFLLTTEAYKAFVSANSLQPTILQHAGEASPELVESAELASAAIRRSFQAALLPSEIAAAIKQAYAAVGNDLAVAVRSSATAEDLPGMSFAGQQDTYLNIRGADALLDAVQRCWASLWTARAISYRAKMSVDHASVAMGVVVQVMLDADTSGVLFTANPTSGDRSEMIVNASFGLGEAIVSGAVTPDTFVVDRASLTATQSAIGSKRAMVSATEQSGTKEHVVPREQRSQLSLSAEQIRKLAELSLKAEQALGGQPQDIEWAMTQDRFWLLQSRPITSLPAPPLRDVAWEPPAGAKRLLRRQVVENMPAPLSPLFEELYLNKGLDDSIDEFAKLIGMPFDINQFISRPMFITVNGYGYCRYDFYFSKHMLLSIPRILFWYVRSLPGLMRNLVPMWQEDGLPAYLAEIDQWQAIDINQASDEQLIAGVRALTFADARYWFYLTMMVGAAKVTEGMLGWFLSTWAVQGDLTSGMFMTGFPSRTLEAQENLDAIAARIVASDSLRELVRGSRPEALLEMLDANPEAAAVAAEIRKHLQIYGHQVYNLDYVEPTQGEDPLAIYVSLQASVRGAATTSSGRRSAMAQERDALTARTLATLGPIRRRLLKKLLSWAQRFGPYREEALFYMGAGWPTLRKLALTLGERLTKAGILSAADGVFYLRSQELSEAGAARAEQRLLPQLTQTEQQRRELRAARERLHPPGRVPQDLRFKFGPFDFTRYFRVWETQKLNSDDTNTLTGFAVSPGSVTGRACVILSPADFAQMQPGTILVCPTTTPAWTPLFAKAAGLVTDIGAVLAHGSIVAREYGIPAVLGTGNSTRRIVSGQLITVDGNAGTVTLFKT
ncbi:MAG: PEP/pyruvate-binding domain-containing protein [Pseudomonadales bacterium]